MKKSNRRKFILGGLGILGTGLAAGWFGRRSILRWGMQQPHNAQLQLTPAPASEGEICVMTSRQVEGPFYFPSPERRDIREDRKGLEMNLRMQVVRHPDCTPIEGAIVEVWHTDADGAYSGYPAEIAHDIWKTFLLVGKHGEKRNGEYHVDPVQESRFLRGLQRTDATGWVTFNTIFPGWYEGRVPHIHFKVFIGDREQINSQFYLDQATCDHVYTAVAPYDQYGKCPLSFEKDIALADTANGLLLKPVWSDNTPLEALARIGIVSG